MASTLTPTTFKTTIIEEQVVGNYTLVNQVVYNLPNVTNVDRRVVTCPTNESINLIDINNTNPGAGTFPSGSLKYVRVSNLDDTFNVAITFSGSQGTFTQELLPTSSMFISSVNITSSNFNGSFGDGLKRITAYAISSSVDVEYTVVNV